MDKLWRMFLMVFILSGVIILLIDVPVYAQPTVQLRLDPDIRTFIAGLEPKQIRITTLTNQEDLQFAWKIEGEGKLEEKNPNSGALYTPPDHIAEKSWTTITVIVTDNKSKTAEDKVTFTLIPKPDIQEEDPIIGKEKAIEKLLREADELFKRKQYLTPPEENAFDLYKAVLRLAPQNEHALESIRSMLDKYKHWGDSYYKTSQNSIQAKDYYEKYVIIAEYLGMQEAVAEATRRLKVITALEEADGLFQKTRLASLPQPSEFEAYRMNVELAANYYKGVLKLEPANSYAQSKIRSLLTMNTKWADYTYRQAWFTTPEKKNAFEYYKIVLDLDPQNQNARQKILAITKSYKQRGDENYRQEKFEDAKTWYERYLEVANYILNELQDQSIQTEYDEVQARIKTL